jgi:hypothetical protein
MLPELRKNYLVYKEESVKWYEDYEYVQYATKFYKESADAVGFVGYKCSRIGEDENDYVHDMEGNSSGELIYYERKLFINVGQMPNAEIEEYGESQIHQAERGDYPCVDCTDANIDDGRCVNEDRCKAFQTYSDWEA